MLKPIKKNCEYFLISGFNKNRKPYDLTEIYNQGEEICIADVKTETDFFHYKEPIVEIQIIHTSSRELLSKAYHIVDRTYSKLYKADFNSKTSSEELYLCFRYGRDLPPIIDIGAIKTKQKNIVNQDDWCLIEKTFDGQSANLHNSSSNPLYIAYRRALSDAPVDDLVVTDICVTLANKRESCPPAYTIVDVPIKRSPISNTINICYKKSVVKQYVLTFEPEIIYCLSSASTDAVVDVYNPDTDKCKSPDCLPEDIRGVANFCMPWGATLESWPSELQSPRPSFITFVLTNIKYDRLYGAAMLFYEDFDKHQLSEDEATNLGLQIEGRSDIKVFASKSICILSRCPLFQTFNKVLSFLIQEDERQRSGIELQSSPSNHRLPLERYISQFLYLVPLPTPEVPNILLQWDLNNAISIQLPTDPISKFGTSENFYHLVRLLDVEQIIELFLYMLTEQKILLTSTCNSDLTGISEALLSMIFPFRWSVVYIPFLYLGCIHIIQSPSPYLIGVDSRFFDYFCLPEGVGCIDLINKSIKPPDSTSKFFDYNKVFPKNILKSLRFGLSNCKVKVESFEKTHKMQRMAENNTADFTILRTKEIIGESIRECFLKAVVLMFKNYQAYLLPLSKKQEEDDMFDIDGFLKSVDKNSRPLYLAIFDTQLWNHFINERSYVTEFDNSLAFFDRCIKYVQAMDEDQANMSCLLQTDSVIKSEHTKVVPLPHHVKGWLPDITRKTFPQRLDSELMLAIIDACEEDDHVPGVLSIQVSEVSQIQYRNQETSTNHVNSPSSLPIIHIRCNSIGGHNDTAQSTMTSVLRRPFEEVKQANQLGKEAKRGTKHVWAGHLLSSSFCLWFLSLPGFIGYVQDSPVLAGTGLIDRILELAIEMIESIVNYRLILPDQVCLRVLLLLVHQINSPRLHVSHISKQAHLNVFSYGLCNQILLEEDALLSNSPSSRQGSRYSGTVDLGRESTDGEILSRDRSNHVDPDTLATNNSNGMYVESSTQLESIVSNKVHLEPCIEDESEDWIQSPDSQKCAKRTSELLYQSMATLRYIDDETRHQFFNRATSVVISSDPRDLADNSSPIIKITRSHIVSDYHPDISSESLDSAIIAQSPSSEESSELRASIMIGKHESVNDSLDCSTRLSLTQASINSTDPGGTMATGNTNHLPEPTVTASVTLQPNVSSTDIAITRRTSLSQFKRAANRSFKSVRRFMSSVGSHIQAQTHDQKVAMPAIYKPWDHNKEQGIIAIPHTGTKTIQQRSPAVDNKRHTDITEQRRKQRDSGSQMSPDGSVTNIYKYNSEINNLGSNGEPPLLHVDKIWEKITGSLSAVRVPIGRYWPDKEIISGQPLSSVECIHSLTVTMTTSSECTNCHWVVYDEDIMNGWSYNDSDLLSLCPYCGFRFAPILAFKILVNQHNTDLNNVRTNIKQTKLAYESDIIYLSPFVLRKELESVLQQEGEQALLRPDFLHKHSILYWNLMLYYSRLSLPSHMLSFVTLWLRDHGRRMTCIRENMSKSEILVNLTGHEEVFVIFALEMDHQTPKTVVPVYRIYLDNASSKLGETLSTQQSPIKTLLGQVVDALFKTDIEQAIMALLRFSSSKEAADAKCSRSMYRELKHLAILVLDKHGLNLETFHYMYQSGWQNLIKAYPSLTDSRHGPSSDSAFYCGRVFRAAQL